MDTILEIKNLNLFFDEYQALYDVSLALEKGKMLALAGESGCGKTMTAMSVMRLLPKKASVKSGEVIFKGENILYYTEKQMRELRGNKIALIPQDPMTSLNPLYTVGNQIIEAIKAHTKVSDNQAVRRAKEVLDMVKMPDIDNKLKSYPHELSGGMKQRVIIGMALAANAELLIADEPTTALDVTIQKQIMDLIDEIKKEIGTTILMISHDLALISNYADDISVMYSGHIVEKAEASEFFQRPMHPYSQALMDSLPSKNPLLRLKTIEGAPPAINEQITGCKFHPRCNFCVPKICTVQRPILKEKNKNHLSACLIR